MYRVTLLLLLLFALLPSRGQNQVDANGLKTGYWKAEYPNGRTFYEAEFLEGKPVGEMIRYYDSGAVRARMMFDTLLDRSYARLFYQNGAPAAEGWYVEKEKDSVWTYYSEFDRSVRIREPYIAGKLNGKVQSYYPSGVVSEEITWVNHLKQGPWKQFYENGVVRLSSHYEKDQLQGVYQVFYSNGTLKVSGEYMDNKSHATWTFFDEKGEEVYALEYISGRPVDQEKYNQWIQDSLMKYEVIPEPESFEQFYQETQQP